MLIINGGVPRSGTVLVGQIVSALLARHGIDRTRYSPQERRHLPEFAQRVADWAGPGALLVHTHVADRTVLEALAARSDAAVFWNYRDPRDALVSLRRLHEVPMERALYAMEVYFGIDALVADSGLARRLRYETLVADVPAAIKTIAADMKLSVNADDVAEIHDQTKPERHAAVMRAVAEGAVPGASALRTQYRTLREDPDTLINDRHIQSGRSGRWREELSPEEQAQAAARLGPWIQALGYATE